MSRVRITAAEWVEHHRQGDAKIVDGQRHVVALEPVTGEPALVQVDIEDEPDARCAVIDGRLDAEDMARAHGIPRCTVYGDGVDALCPRIVRRRRLRVCVR